MINLILIKNLYDLCGEEYYNDDQISELVYEQMEKTGRWKIVLTEGTLSGHTLHNNGNITKLNFNGIYMLLFQKNGLVETSQKEKCGDDNGLLYIEFT